jgi:hypothetical protein
MKTRKLNVRQQRFVEAYDGNATEAASKAGYTGSRHTLEVQASYLMRNPVVVAAIQARGAVQQPAHIYGMLRAERQEFWARMAADPSVKHSDRLRASELLGKSMADFVERHQVDVGETTLAALLAKARK